MYDEITSRSDILGALILGHPLNGWWCGSDRSIEESRRLVPGQNVTTTQVAVSVVAAVLWMLDHPHRGLPVPDDHPHECVLRVAKPSLGTFLSKATDWTPQKHAGNVLAGCTAPRGDATDPWQFAGFLLTHGD